MKGLGPGKDGPFEKAGSIFLDENGEGPDVIDLLSTNHNV